MNLPDFQDMGPEELYAYAYRGAAASSDAVYNAACVAAARAEYERRTGKRCSRGHATPDGGVCATCLAAWLRSATAI